MVVGEKNPPILGTINPPLGVFSPRRVFFFHLALGGGGVWSIFLSLFWVPPLSGGGGCFPLIVWGVRSARRGFCVQNPNIPVAKSPAG